LWGWNRIRHSQDNGVTAEVVLGPCDIARRKIKRACSNSKEHRSTRAKGRNKSQSKLAEAASLKTHRRRRIVLDDMLAQSIFIGVVAGFNKGHKRKFHIRAGKTKDLLWKEPNPRWSALPAQA
jgi:hypothetical protein